jgi:exodeoxyribonuclease V gamma subunit
MPGYILHSSNRLEILIDRLSELLEQPLADPFAAEIILVQSKGMERWVSMELANRQGVCANCRFPFPNSYIGELFGMLLPPVLKDSPFAPERLGWKIMDALPGFLDRPTFAEIKSYITNGTGGPGDFKLYQLSRRIADVFDQYLLFRPEMIMRWEKLGRGGDGGWQAELWRFLSRELQAPHRAALLGDFLRQAEKIESSPAFPERISVFGISALPPFHLDALNAASRFTDVHMFVMNPCEEYWGEILSSRQMSRRSRSSKGKDPERDLHMEAGNSLLASMGGLGRDFFKMLLQKAECEEDYLFVAPGRDSLLRSIQSDILELRDSTPEEVPSFSNDRSIEIHSCHSPLREAEVLQDNILALLEERPDIRPRDILVMMPDLETYAPFIESVFSLPESDPRMVPFGIADKGLRVESRTINAFIGLLELPVSRFGAGRVMEILESAGIREKFALTEPDVDNIREWVRDARIRWGLDEAHRESLGLPGFVQNTWRAGLDRMLLGYALPEKDGELFGGTLPFDRIEGGASEALGRFLAFTGRLFAAAAAMKQEYTLAGWSDLLSGVIDDFFTAGDDNFQDLSFLKEAVMELEKFGESLGRKVGLDVVREHLKRRLEMEGFGGRFLSGGITFCAMLPMRSIPFKAICLLGMDDGAYPRESSPPGFDLMAKELRPGDRSRRLDDRYLFLETVLSAREKLYISYIGQDIRDNSERPPSVLVSELLDYLAGGYGITAATVKHALQAFNPLYFQKEGLVSYSRENFAAARSLRAGGPRHAPAFFGEGLSEPDPGYRNVTVDDLCSFFSNPARFLLTRRLGLILDDSADVLDEREPFDVRGLDRHALESALLEKALQGAGIRHEMERLRAGGLIPPGTPGACWFEDTRASMERLAARVAARRRGAALEPLGVDVSLSGFRITGSIAGLYPGGLVLHRPFSRERHLVTFWITRLIMDCAAAALKSPVPEAAVLCTGELDCVYRCPENSPAILSGLLDIYWQGLTRPVPFFPQASWAYARAKHDGKDDAEEKAQQKFEGNDWSRGEGADLYVRRCFAGSDPLEDPQFRELAVSIIGPALENADFEEYKKK